MVLLSMVVKVVVMVNKISDSEEIKKIFGIPLMLLKQDVILVVTNVISLKLNLLINKLQEKDRHLLKTSNIYMNKLLNQKDIVLKKTLVFLSPINLPVMGQNIILVLK